MFKKKKKSLGSLPVGSGGGDGGGGGRGGINETDKALASLTKNKLKREGEREKTHITKIRNKRYHHLKALQVRKGLLNNSMSTNSTILNEMNQFLQKQKLSKFTQKEINSMNITYVRKKLEYVVK